MHFGSVYAKQPCKIMLNTHCTPFCQPDLTRNIHSSSSNKLLINEDRFGVLISINQFHRSVDTTQIFTQDFTNFASDDVPNISV